MGNRKEPQFQVHVIFTPSPDWNIRLKRVMELLLSSKQANKNHNEKGGDDAKTKDD
jgi:hypothetical protein